MGQTQKQASGLDAVQGTGEARTEPYIKYGEGELEPVMQYGACGLRNG
ncbi:MAG: hypothetical protein JWO96_425 [Candidatus Saccharibacteria bacterium]|nr:hypothetical protein [Candidatus Saccharibacteria bacterium]